MNEMRFEYSKEVVACFYEQFNVCNMDFDELLENKNILIRIVDELSIKEVKEDE